jgi:hypothetical protein
MKKSYKQSTPILAIPVLGYNDKILPEVELYRNTVIENFLIAGMQGVKHCVFDEGYWRLNQTADGVYSAVLGATGITPAAHGTVGGAYFKAASQIRWEGLKKGNVYWLYLRATQHTMVDPEKTRVAISNHKLSSTDDCLLMAEVNLRDTEPEINPYPEGKVYSKDIARHANDKENPHGKRLYQDELVITEKLILRSREGVSPMVQVEYDGEVIDFPANMLPGAIAELAGRAVEIIDFESFGKEGGVIKVANRKKVFNVTTQRRVVGDFTGTVGEVAVGYFSEDARADEENEFVVYNAGDEGLPMRAIIFCG